MIRAIAAAIQIELKQPGQVKRIAKKASIARNAAHHGGPFIMHAAVQQLVAKETVPLCRDDLACWKFFQRMETEAMGSYREVERIAEVTFKRQACLLPDDFREKVKGEPGVDIALPGLEPGAPDALVDLRLVVCAQPQAVCQSDAEGIRRICADSSGAKAAISLFLPLIIGDVGLQPCLMREHLADRDMALPISGKIGPIDRHGRVEPELALLVELHERGRSRADLGKGGEIVEIAPADRPLLLVGVKAVGLMEKNPAAMCGKNLAARKSAFFHASDYDGINLFMQKKAVYPQFYGGDIAECICQMLA